MGRRRSAGAAAPARRCRLAGREAHVQAAGDDFEVYLFDFDGDLYGETLRIEFVRRLRGEKKFSSAEALVKQMDKDAARARKVLARINS